MLHATATSLVNAADTNDEEIPKTSFYAQDNLKDVDKILPEGTVHMPSPALAVQTVLPWMMPMGGPWAALLGLQSQEWCLHMVCLALLLPASCTVRIFPQGR